MQASPAADLIQGRPPIADTWDYMDFQGKGCKKIRFRVMRSTGA